MKTEADRMMNSVSIPTIHNYDDEAQWGYLLRKMQALQKEMIKRHLPAMNNTERARANLVLAGKYHGQMVGRV